MDYRQALSASGSNGLVLINHRTTRAPSARSLADRATGHGRTTLSPYLWPTLLLRNLFGTCLDPHRQDSLLELVTSAALSGVM